MQREENETADAFMARMAEAHNQQAQDMLELKRRLQDLNAASAVSTTSSSATDQCEQGLDGIWYDASPSSASSRSTSTESKIEALAKQIEALVNGQQTTSQTAAAVGAQTGSGQQLVTLDDLAFLVNAINQGVRSNSNRSNGTNRAAPRRQCDYHADHGADARHCTGPDCRDFVPANYRQLASGKWQLCHRSTAPHTPTANADHGHIYPNAYGQPNAPRLIYAQPNAPLVCSQPNAPLAYAQPNAPPTGYALVPLQTAAGQAALQQIQTAATQVQPTTVVTDTGQTQPLAQSALPWITTAPLTCFS